MRTFISVLCFIAVLILPVTAMGALVSTDSTIYLTEDSVYISGSGFTPLEDVNLQVTWASGGLIPGDLGQLWTISADGSGTIESDWTTPVVIGDDNLLLLTGTGVVSGQVATRTFLVSPPKNLDQLQNGNVSTSPAWANGNINSSNSCYSEGSSVPYRYLIDNLAAGSQHYFTIGCEWTKAGIHGIDYFTSYDRSEADAIANAGGNCGGSVPSDCDSISGSFPFPNPTLVSNYTGTIPYDFFPGGFVLQGPREMSFYNATVDSIGKYYFGGTSTDRDFSVVVYFTVNSTGSVGFYWGGHLAQGIPSAWGYGMGSGSVSGAPIHARAGLFDGSGGSKDVSIQKGTLCLPPDATITCNSDTVCTGESYTCSAPLGANSYDWSIIGGSIVSGQGTESVTYTVTASYPGAITVTVQACDSTAGCPGDNCCSVDSVDIPLGYCSEAPYAGCPGDTTIFMCDLEEICLSPFECNGTPSVIGGTLNGNYVCLTPVEGVNLITYICTNSYGDADTCEMTVTVILNQPPSLTCPSDVTISCEESSQPSNTGSATATDDHGSPLINHYDTQTTGSCPQEQIISRHWKAIDDCGDSTVCVQTITVIDDTSPVITCPADLTIDCDDPTDPGTTGMATATDNCDASVDVTYADSQADNVITRTWTATDDCGNTDQCVQTITLDDTTPPTLTCPSAIAVQCVGNVPAPDVNLVTTSDNCDANPVVTFVSDVSDGNSCPEIITRTYRSTDASGNFAECTQTITVDDTIDPVITCPANSVVGCNDPTDPGATGTATATDNCDTSVDITYSDSQTGNVITRTWTATDDCGNFAQCSQTITIEDTTPPTITCPDAVTVQCPAEVPAVDIGAITASDACDPSPTITHVGDVSDGNTCPEVITRTYRATDAAGNYAECTQTITIDDTIDPVITCPANRTISCDESTDPANTGSATATDNCTASPAITYSDVETGGACPQEKTIARTWTATDDCGNIDQCVQTITVEDNVDPVITCPANLTIDCNDPTDPGTTGAATATDNCDASVDITYADSQVGNVVTRTWTATDDCGNTDQCQQTITIEDTTPPSLTCPSAVAVQCVGDVPAPNVSLVTTSDDCDPAPVVTFISDVSDGNSCPEIITRTYRSTDASGNYVECTQTITIDDTIDPVITCPADAAVECGGSINPAATGWATATDNCDPNVTVTYVDSKDGNITTRTWTATDDCGNTDQCVQTITVEDTMPPTLTCPNAISVQCVGDVPAPDINLVTTSDDCDPTPVVTFIGDVSDGNSCPEIVTRTYRSTDASGNYAECTQTITIDDTIDPVITCPVNLTIDCSVSTDPISTGWATATDNCDTDIAISYSDSEVAGACGQEKTITRTWTATDDCGNQDQCVQTISVTDDKAPSLTCPDNITIDCLTSTLPDATGTATATDNCDTNVDITYVDSQVGNVITRTWTATDDCGNTDQCEQTITIEDTTPPTLTCPDAIAVQCASEVPAPDINLVTTSDDCDPAPVVTFVSDASDGNSCPEIITRTYRSTDASGNYDECTQTITVDDTIDPVITCPANITIACDASTDPVNTGSATATDNCTASPAITYADSETGGDCPQEKTITRTWTATDDCGNTDQCVQTITVEDNVAPDITCPPAITISCEDPTDPAHAGSATATDNCDPNPALTYADNVVPGASSYEFEITRTWTATDACGNSSDCQQVITVEDTTDPEIACPPDIQLECGQSTDPDSVGIAVTEDNCDPNPQLTYSDSQNGNVITRTWTVTDADGNSAQCQQTITLGDGTDPVCSVPDNQTMFQCAPTEVSLPVSASHNAVCEVVSGPGEIIGGNWVYTPTGNQTVTATVRCTDACDRYCESTFQITFAMNSAPTASMLATDITPFCGPSGNYEICVPFSYSDPDDDVADVWIDGDVAVSLTYANGTGEFCFTPPAVDAVLYFDLNVEDDCGVVTTKTHQRTIDVDEQCDTTTCLVLEIQDTDCLTLGSYAYVDILIDALTEEMAGFDLLISYDASAFAFTNAQIGTAIDTWEYFTYRVGPFGNCGGPCPSGLLRLIGIADVSNGPNHPNPAQYQPDGVLATMVFRITRDQNFSGFTYPVNFFWIDCGDNGVSSVTGDTLFIDKLVLNTDNSVLWNEYDELNYPESDRIPNVGAPDDCLLGDKTVPRRCVVYINGSICIIHPDSIDARGDVNLNGISHEIADAVLLTNYFLYGISVFVINPAGQMAASEINNDGVQATVGDLVYLIRVITGDALPYAKLAPFAQEVDINYDGQTVSMQSDDNLGALLLTFKVDGGCQLTNLTDMTMVESEVNGELKVLIYDISTKSIASGLSDILRIDGNAELVDAQAANYRGSMMSYRISAIALPESFSLSQNYPNPFNPETVIEFALPQTADVTLEVYNVAGQKVATVTSGPMTAGYHRVTFDGRDDYGNQLASGIYLYRLTTNGYSETRKMILVK